MQDLKRLSSDINIFKKLLHGLSHDVILFSSKLKFLMIFLLFDVFLERSFFRQIRQNPISLLDIGPGGIEAQLL